jgi:hypothetical protein
MIRERDEKTLSAVFLSFFYVDRLICQKSEPIQTKIKILLLVTSDDRRKKNTAIKTTKFIVPMKI